MAKNTSGKAAIETLSRSRGNILSKLRRIVSSGNFNYRTFGTEIEEHLAAIIIDIFTKNGLIENEKDYTLAPHKNYFPDFELMTIPPIAIEFKSGNRKQNRGGKWVKVKNSENDMGTLGEWPKRMSKYGGNNIYYIFVVYNFDETTRQVQNIEIAPFYEFLGLSKSRVLKYREKDGNLRPKDFDAKSPIKTLGQFNRLFDRTVVYRSKRIIQKHKQIIKDSKAKRSKKV